MFVPPLEFQKDNVLHNRLSFEDNNRQPEPFAFRQDREVDKPSHRIIQYHIN